MRKMLPYSTVAAAKSAVISAGEEIESLGLPSEICPLVFVITGSGNGTFYMAVSLVLPNVFQVLMQSTIFSITQF